MLPLPYRSKSRSVPDPSAASTHVDLDRSECVRDGRLPFRTGQNPRSPQQPAHKRTDDSLTLRSKSASHASRGGTTLSWDLLLRAARKGIWTPVLLAHTFPRMEPKGSGSRTHTARGGTLVCCRTGGNQGQSWTAVRLPHTSTRMQPKGLGKPDPHSPWMDTRILPKLS